MATTLTIKNTLVNNVQSDAEKVNENFAAVQTLINGKMTDDNIDELPESVIKFNGSGHAHSGGSDGTKIALADIDGDISLDIAIENGEMGSFYVESGDTAILAAGESETVELSNITFMTSMPLVGKIQIDDTFNTQYFGATTTQPLVSFTITALTGNSFTITSNDSVFEPSAYRWKVVGI